MPNSVATLPLKQEEMGVEAASSSAQAGVFGGEVVILVGALFCQAEGDGQGLRLRPEWVENWECATRSS